MSSPVKAFLAWSTVWKRGQEFLFRVSCPLCGRSTPAVFCLDCTRKLRQHRRSDPRIESTDLPPLYCWGHYEGALKQGLAKLKYDRQDSIAVALGQWLAETWSLQASCIQAVVPIPLHSQRQLERGYNQAQLIAKSFCQNTGLPLLAQGLVRTRATTAQYSLSRSDRYRNLQHSFAAGPDLQHVPPSTPMILIDDIFTTGATFKAAVNTLNESKIHVAALFAVAAPRLS